SNAAAALALGDNHSHHKTADMARGVRPRCDDIYLNAGDEQDEEIVNSTDGSGGLVVLAVDDEKPALDELEYLLGQDQRVGTVLTASNAEDALRQLSGRERRDGSSTNPAAGSVPVHPLTGTPIVRSTDVDVVYLDIRMPGLDGLELARVFSRM